MIRLRNNIIKELKNDLLFVISLKTEVDGRMRKRNSNLLKNNAVNRHSKTRNEKETAVLICDVTTLMAP